jgi:hypothetical protein
LADERTIDGPPISIFSMMSSSAIGGAGIFRHGLRERVEIDDDEIDRADLMLGHGSGMLGIVAHREQPAMHLGVERLDPPVHHFGETGKFGNVLHLEPCFAQRLGGAAGRNKFDAVAGEDMAEIGEAGLIGDGEKRALDRNVGHAPRL